MTDLQYYVRPFAALGTLALHCEFGGRIDMIPSVSEIVILALHNMQYRYVCSIIVTVKLAFVSCVYARI